MSWSLVFWLLLGIFLMWKAGRMTWNKMEQMLMDWSWLLRTEARDVLAERESDPRQDKGHYQKPCPSKNTPCERKSSIPPVSQFSHLNPLTPPNPNFSGDLPGRRAWPTNWSEMLVVQCLLPLRQYQRLRRWRYLPRWPCLAKGRCVKIVRKLSLCFLNIRFIEGSVMC